MKAMPPIVMTLALLLSFAAHAADPPAPAALGPVDTAAPAATAVPGPATDVAPAVAAREAAPAPPATPRKGPQQLDLDTTSIRGNQELPKVLYIVPWKDPALGEPAGRPLNSLVDEALSPVDREVFRRQMNYFDQLYGPAAARPGDGTTARSDSAD